MGKKAIGIDLGGTAIKGAVIDENGISGEVTRVPTEAQSGGQRVMENILSLIEKLTGAGGGAGAFVGVGIGTPGFVGADGVILGGAENLPGWKGTQVYAPISERFGGLRATAANDVTSVALAELKYGAGRGVQNIVCFALGTGVGGGIVTNGRLYKGTHGMAGEIGHIIVETGGEPCPCGQCGCVERYASATGIVNMAVGMAAQKDTPETEFLKVVKSEPGAVTSKLVYEYVAKEDPVAIAVHERACDMLGRAVGIMINTFSPDKVVLGGGVMMAGGVVLEAVKKYAARHCWPAIYERCEIVIAKMGEDAGVLGAGALALEEFD